MRKRSGKKQRRTMFPVGVNAHAGVDNVITLFRSSNDLYDGTIDFIFFKVLNMSPEAYFNFNEVEGFSDAEIEEMQTAFENYSNKYVLEMSQTLINEINEIILHIRGNAIIEGLIEEVYKQVYSEINTGFNFKYILKQVLLFYKNKKRRK